MEPFHLQVRSDPRSLRSQEVRRGKRRSNDRRQAGGGWVLLDLGGVFMGCSKGFLGFSWDFLWIFLGISWVFLGISWDVLR